LLRGSTARFLSAPSTLEEWFARAADPDEKVQIFRDFAGSIAQARAQFEITSLGIVAAGGAPAATQGGRPGDWRGRAWLLERLKPERFGPPTKKLEHSGTGPGGAIRITGAVELPAEVPDGQERKGLPSPLNGRAKEAAPALVTEGVSLPAEEDPD
jgi:hypothetical protein